MPNIKYIFSYLNICIIFCSNCLFPFITKLLHHFRSSLSEERRISTASSGAESSDAADDMSGKPRGSKSKKQVITHRAVTNVNHLDIPAQVK